MEFSTKVEISRAPFSITHADRVMFIGSCFASEMGSQMASGRMPVMINPAGTVYNPVSVIRTLNNILSGKRFTEEDLYLHKGTWLSFSHYTGFTSTSSKVLLDKINLSNGESLNFLKQAGYLFVTFGTARVFRLADTGEIVSNCHKLPPDFFTRELLGASEIAGLWHEMLERLGSLVPGLKVIFTISPVRHWKDGAHGNQVSKSVLFLAVEDLLKHHSSASYFPAYEILIDELRDYRFYDDDMLHPSSTAISYIWEGFTRCYFDQKTLSAWKEASSIVKATRHRITGNSPEQARSFAENMLGKISVFEKAHPSIDMGGEKEYFQNILKENSRD